MDPVNKYVISDSFFDAKAVNGTTKCLKLRLGADEAISAVQSISGVIMKHVSHTWLLRVI